MIREPPKWYREMLILGSVAVVSESCSCGASTQRLAVVADPFAEWRRDHVCRGQQDGDEAPAANDAPLVVDSGEPADHVGFRLLGEDEP